MPRVASRGGMRACSCWPHSSLPASFEQIMSNFRGSSPGETARLTQTQGARVSANEVAAVCAAEVARMQCCGGVVVPRQVVNVRVWCDPHLLASPRALDRGTRRPRGGPGEYRVGPRARGVDVEGRDLSPSLRARMRGTSTCSVQSAEREFFATLINDFLILLGRTAPGRPRAPAPRGPDPAARRAGPGPAPGGGALVCI